MAEIKRTMDINFYGVVHETKAFLPHQVNNHWAALVNVSLIGPPSNADYCASKFAMRGFTVSTHTAVHETE